MRCPLTPNQAQLARAGRCLNGLAQTINLGANIFLADDGGRYSVASAIIASAAHAGPASPSIEAAHLNDDLHVVTLSNELLAATPIELRPNIAQRVMVPPNVEAILLTELERVG